MRRFALAASQATGAEDLMANSDWIAPEMS
jgi:hypothetical protein